MFTSFQELNWTRVQRTATEKIRRPLYCPCPAGQTYLGQNRNRQNHIRNSRCLCNLKFSKNIFFSIILNIIYFYIQNRVTYFYKRKKILSNQKFKIYFILYLFEKIKMISEDIKFITSTKEKKEIKKFILLLNEILRRSVEK